MLSSGEGKGEEYLFLICVLGLLMPGQLGTLKSLASVAEVQLLLGQAGT